MLIAQAKSSTKKRKGLDLKSSQIHLRVGPKISSNWVSVRPVWVNIFVVFGLQNILIKLLILFLFFPLKMISQLESYVTRSTATGLGTDPLPPSELIAVLLTPGGDPTISARLTLVTTYITRFVRHRFSKVNYCVLFISSSTNIET